MSLAVKILWCAQLPVRPLIVRSGFYESNLYLASEAGGEFIQIEVSQFCYSDVSYEKPSRINEIL